jgi:X-X-X-Leu-X-X-Gly heptad repeat protein
VDTNISTAVDVTVLVALVILAVSLAILTGAIMPLLRQFSSTALSFQKLSETMEREVSPTMVELRSVMDGINQIKAITTQRVQDVSSKAGELTDGVTTLVTSAKKESTVASAGVLAGLKAYLFPHPQSQETRKSESMQIPLNREQKNV